MIQVILHIGRHKTGTTSLQRFLYDNPEFLEQHGFVYPNIHIRVCAHHNLAEVFLGGRVKGMSRATLREQIRIHREQLMEMLDDPSRIYILSSEAFQNVSPSIVAKLFPSEHYNVRVVCYFREQVSYVASAYNQKIHATRYDDSMDVFYKNVFNGNYLEFAKKWCEIFPDHYFNLYQMQDLIGGDVVKDFIVRVLGLDIPGFYSPESGNASLSHNMLRAKQAINRSLNNGELEITFRRGAYYKALPELVCGRDDGRSCISMGLKNRIEKHHKNSNQEFLSQYLCGKSFSEFRNICTEEQLIAPTDYDLAVVLKKIANMERPRRFRHFALEEYVLLEEEKSVDASRFHESLAGRAGPVVGREVGAFLFERIRLDIPTTAIRFDLKSGYFLNIKNIFTKQFISTWSIDRLFSLLSDGDKYRDETKVAMAFALSNALNDADLVGVSGLGEITDKNSAKKTLQGERVAKIAMLEHLVDRCKRNGNGDISMGMQRNITQDQWSSLIQGKRTCIITDGEKKSERTQRALGAELGFSPQKTYRLPSKLTDIAWNFGSCNSKNIYFSTLRDIFGEEDRHGEIFLVNAGLLGGLCAHFIKQQGGIAIDAALIAPHNLQYVL